MNVHLDASFALLADVTRRGVLEEAGHVITVRVGRLRTCQIARRLEEAAVWIERYHQLWDARFWELDKVVEESKRKEKLDGSEKPK